MKPPAKAARCCRCSPTLIGMEQTVRQQRALERRIRQARLPKRKSLADYDFNFPKRVPRTAIVRLFDCEFIPHPRLCRLDWTDRHRQDAFSHALGYTACERGYSVCYTRVVDMLNQLTAARSRAGWPKHSRLTSVPLFSSSMSWAICPSTSAGPTCCSRWLLPVMNTARSC